MFCKIEHGEAFINVHVFHSYFSLFAFVVRHGKLQSKFYVLRLCGNGLNDGCNQEADLLTSVSFMPGFILDTAAAVGDIVVIWSSAGTLAPAGPAKKKKF